MTLLKINKTKILILTSIGILTVFVLLLQFENSCGIRHIGIINDLNLYEKSLNPEFCEVIVEKIDSFNFECSPEVEILDCG